MLGSSSAQVEALKLNSSNGGNNRGSVNISDTLECSNGTWTFQPEADVIDYGRHLIGIRGAHRVLAPTDAPIDFDTVMIGSASEGSLSVYFDTGQPVNIGELDINKGAIYGFSPINILGTLTWNRDGFRSGGAVTAFGPVVLEIPSGSGKFLDRTVKNTQTTTMLGGGLGLGGSLSVRWNNHPGAFFHIQANSVSISGRTFENAGTILRSFGDGVATITSRIENSGLIHNQTGTMSLSGSAMHSGEVRSHPGTLLKLGGNGHNFRPTSILHAETLDLTAVDSTCQGTVEITDAIMCNGCSWTFATDANIISYGVDLSVSAGVLHIDAPTDRSISFDSVAVGPNFNGSNIYLDTGQPVNINTLVMDDKASFFGTSPIRVSDNLVWRNGNFFPGGALNLDGDTVVHTTSSARTCHRHLFNAGNFIMLGGFSLGSTRQLTNLPAGVYDIQGDTSRISSGTFQNEGLLVRSAGSGAALFQNTDLFNTGTVEFQSGELEFASAGYIQTAGRTILNGGNLTMTNGTIPVRIDGGSLMGVGTVFGNVINDGGAIEPGLSAGELSIDGDYDQSVNGTLDIEIGGTDLGRFDVLTVTGTATLSGALRVIGIDPFVPQAGDT